MANIVYKPVTETQDKNIQNYARQAQEFMLAAQRDAEDMSGISGISNAGASTEYTANQQNGSQGTGGYSKTNAAAIEADSEFQQHLSTMIAKYPGLTKDALYRTMERESAFNTSAQNSLGSGASGLFQLMPVSAKRVGTTTADILNMSATDQLKIYEKYLDSWNYTGGSLSMMQAAPAFANASNDTVIYDPIRHKSVYAQNPKWIGPNGLITAGSVRNFFGD